MFMGNGTENKQGSLKDGVKVGSWVEYDKNGPVPGEVTYKNGKKDTWVTYTYHKNGRVKTKEHYKDGKIDGLRETYDENGKLYSKGHFKNGEKDGLWEEYHDNGKLHY